MFTRSEQLRAALAARLERVHATMSHEEFSQPIADVIRTAQRLEEIDARGKR
jgi:hypothetical protein